MIHLRPAEQTDTNWVFAMCEDFARFYQSRISLAGNPEYGKKFISDLIKNHYVRVAHIDGEPAGFIAGLVAPHHFNPEILQLTELLWWVPEQHRGTGVGMKLFNEFMTYGEEYCDWVTFTLEENSPISDKFLTTRGFKMSERAYLKEC